MSVGSSTSRYCTAASRIATALARVEARLARLSSVQAAVEIDDTCTGTLRLNRPRWNVVTKDIRELDGHDYRGVDLLAGVPCSPFR